LGGPRNKLADCPPGFLGVEQPLPAPQLFPSRPSRTPQNATGQPIRRYESSLLTKNRRPAELIALECFLAEWRSGPPSTPGQVKTVGDPAKCKIVALAEKHGPPPRLHRIKNLDWDSRTAADFLPVIVSTPNMQIEPPFSRGELPWPFLKSRVPSKSPKNPSLIEGASRRWAPVPGLGSKLTGTVPSSVQSGFWDLGSVRDVFYIRDSPCKTQCN